MDVVEGVIRLTGALFIFTAAVLWGEMKARSLVYRVRNLQQFQQALRLLSTEISYTATPLPYAFSRLGSRVGGRVGDLFLRASRVMLCSGDKSAREAWLEAVKDFEAVTFFSREDRQVLEQLGVSLGLSDREGQLKQIKLVSQQLEYALEEARQARNKSERMWRYLGVLGGLALVIFFV